MATQNLGRVGLVLKGEWDSATAYTALDVVSHDGNTWAAKQSNTNVEPTTANSDFWQLFSNNADLVATLQGLKEDAANSATAAAASAADAEASAQYGEDAFNAIAHTFDTGVDYTAGQYVWYEGELYRFNAAHPAGTWIGTDAARYTATDEFPLIQQALGTKADAAEVADLKSAIDRAEFAIEQQQFLLQNLAPFNSSLVTAQYGTVTTTEYQHDYAVIASGSGSATPRCFYTLPSTPDISASDIMYVSMKVYAGATNDSDVANLYRPNIFGQSQGDDSNFHGNTWYSYAKRYTQTSTVTGKITVAVSYISTSAAKDNTIHIKDLVVVNLTKTYGAGNEPSADEMAALIAANDGYIEKINLYNAKQIAMDVDKLNEHDSEKTANIFVTAVNYQQYANPTNKNDGTEYSSANSATSVSITPAITGEIGDIFYGWGMFKVVSTASCSSIVGTANNGMIVEDTEIENPDNDTWYPASVRFSKGTNTGGGAARFIATWANANSIKLYYKHVIALNLTAVFGKFNEPSKEAMDQYFNAVSQANAIDFVSANTKVFNLGCYTRKISHPRGNYVFVDETGNVQMGSVPSPSWPGWAEIGTYGQNNVQAIPIYNKVHGTLETDGMMSVVPIWGCWSDNAASTGNTHHGGHVFHGWTTDRMHRLTMVQNIYRDDEAAVFNYIPGDKSETSEGIFLRLRLGADNNYKGVLIENEYGGNNNSDYRMARMTVYGRLNITRHNNYNNIPASANDSGTPGDICVDKNYIYVCTAENTWKRVPLQTWT